MNSRFNILQRQLNPSNFTRRQLITAGIIGAASITALVLGKSHFNGGVCKIKKDLTGKVVIITGSNTGIGKETARALAAMNATIILACRDSKRTLPVVAELKIETHNQNIEFMQLDLTDLASVRSFATNFKSKYDRLDILINNAGVMMVPTRQLTKDGFELQFGTNHVGHFLLTKLLIDVIKASAPSRIINISSMVQENGKMNWNDLMFMSGYDPMQAYFQSKLANVIFSKELQRRMDLENVDVKVVSVHPGVVRTELTRYLLDQTWWKILLFVLNPIIYYTTKNSKQGAQTTLYCALEEHGKLKGGEYYSDCQTKPPNPIALEDGVGTKLWQVTESLIAEQPL